MSWGIRAMIVCETSFLHATVTAVLQHIVLCMIRFCMFMSILNSSAMNYPKNSQKWNPPLIQCQPRRWGSVRWATFRTDS